MKHTPGPWIQGPTDEDWTCSVRDADGLSVAWCDSFPPEQSHANARLIAAAPEMLTMLKNILEAHNTCGYSNTFSPAGWEELKALIEKAEGK